MVHVALIQYLAMHYVKQHEISTKPVFAYICEIIQ